MCRCGAFSAYRPSGPAHLLARHENIIQRFQALLSPIVAICGDVQGALLEQMKDGSRRNLEQASHASLETHRRTSSGASIPPLESDGGNGGRPWYDERRRPSVFNGVAEESRPISSQKVYHIRMPEFGRQEDRLHL